jgi:hypothetical protein
MNIEQLAVRVRAEFHEMPGLRLTLEQARRLWNLEEHVCVEVVNVLVSRTVLRNQGGTISLAE